MMHFDWPWMLLLLPLPWLIYRFAPADKNSAAALFLPLLDQYSLASGDNKPPASSRLSLILLTLCWLCLLLACAKPMYIGQAIPLDNTGRDVFLAVDISGSMKITDMELNGQVVDRITMIKNVLSDFIKKRQGDRLGLILFASKAYVQAPLTRDLSTVKQLLNEALVGFAGQQTAIGDAIALAVKRLSDKPHAQRTVILLTDGANNAGDFDPIEAAKRAKQAQVIIHTIAFGSNKPRPSGFFGMSMGNYSDDMDEHSLQEIATITGGRYFRARNHQELQAIYDTIDKIERHKLDKTVYRPQHSLFYWPLAAAMLLFILFLISRHRSKI